MSPKQFGAWWALVHSADIIPYKEDILGFPFQTVWFSLFISNVPRRAMQSRQTPVSKEGEGML